MGSCWVYVLTGEALKTLAACLENRTDRRTESRMGWSLRDTKRV